MKIAAIPQEFRQSFASSEDAFGRIDYTSPPRRPGRRRRRPQEDEGNPSTIFPKAATVSAYVSERNPHGTDYVKALLERIDSGEFPHELDERRRAEDDDAALAPMRDAS